MFEVLKSVHLISLLLGGAASIGNAVLLKRVLAAGAQTPPMVVDAMGALAKMGLGAIVLLWLTGLPLAVMTEAFAAGGMLFGVKLLVATVALALILGITWLRAQVAAGHRPANPALIKRLLAGVLWMVILAIVLAVVVFN
ncbi:MAG: hypothetical protein WA784_07840 [Albidovulum sp.]